MKRIIIAVVLLITAPILASAVGPTLAGSSAVCSSNNRGAIVLSQLSSGKVTSRSTIFTLPPGQTLSGFKCTSTEAAIWATNAQGLTTLYDLPFGGTVTTIAPGDPVFSIDGQMFVYKGQGVYGIQNGRVLLALGATDKDSKLRTVVLDKDKQNTLLSDLPATPVFGLFGSATAILSISGSGAPFVYSGTVGSLFWDTGQNAYVPYAVGAIQTVSLGFAADCIPSFCAYAAAGTINTVSDNGTTASFATGKSAAITSLAVTADGEVYFTQSTLSPRSAASFVYRLAPNTGKIDLYQTVAGNAVVLSPGGVLMVFAQSRSGDWDTVPSSSTLASLR